jgi:hypothetical protein
MMSFVAPRDVMEFNHRFPGYTEIFFRYQMKRPTEPAEREAMERELLPALGERLAEFDPEKHGTASWQFFEWINLGFAEKLALLGEPALSASGQ